MAQHSLIVPVSEDTYFDSNYPNTSFTSSLTLRYDGRSIEEPDPPFRYKFPRGAVFKWTPKYPPDGKPIDECYLWLNREKGSEYSIGVLFNAFKNGNININSATFNNISIWVDNASLPPTTGKNGAGNWLGYRMYQTNSGYDPYYRQGSVMLAAFNGLVGGQEVVQERLVSSTKSNNKPYIEVIYSDSTPNAPTSLTPRSGSKYDYEVIRFSWQHNDPNDKFQAGYQIEYLEGSSSINPKTVYAETGFQYRDFAIKTFKPGLLRWRVQTWVENVAYGPWSAYAEFEVLPSAPDAPADLAPVNINVDSQNAIRLSWVYSSLAMDTQAGFKIEYSVNEGAVVTVQQASSNQFYNVPANTFADGSVTWRVQVYDVEGDWGPWSSYVTFSTLKGIPFAPINLNPDSDYRDLTHAIRFAWSHNHPFGEPQYRYDLQYANNSTVYTTVSQQTSNQYRDFAANTFDPGVVSWRVRTYNNRGQAGEWSYFASFFAVGAPAAATITQVTDTNLPTVKWTSTGQWVWQLQIVSDGIIVYDTAYQPGSEVREHTVQTFLSPGSYEVRVRIKNEFDIASEWAVRQFTISQTVGLINAAVLRASNVKNGINLQFDALDARGIYHIVYRALAPVSSNDFIAIKRLAPFTEQYTDFTSEDSVEYVYFLRSVTTGRAYADSNLAVAAVKIRGYAFASARDPEDIVELKLNAGNYPAVSHNVEYQHTKQFFSGRERPVIFYTGLKNRTLRFNFWLRNQIELNEFMRLYEQNEVVLYRSPRGIRVYGELSGLTIDETHLGYRINFMMTETEYSEAVNIS